MPSALEAAGATREPSEYATLSMDRAITGLWTQRSPLRDADVPYLYGKFYSASRFDSLIDGINREITARLTNARRAGSSPWNTNTFPAINFFYSFKWIQGGTQTIRVIADGQDGVIYDATAGQKTSLFTKSAGAGKARFLGVGSTLYFSDGVDLKQLIRSYYVWASLKTFAAGQFIIDSNSNIQIVTAITTGVSGASQPSWASTIGATTPDAGVTWTCKGSSIQNWGIAAPTAAPTVANATVLNILQQWGASTFYLVGEILLDSNGNLQYDIITGVGNTGTTPPTWQTTIGNVTTDNVLKWACLGTATRATNHNYYGGVATQSTAFVSTGVQTMPVLSSANMYIGQPLSVDAGSQLEVVIVTAVGTNTFTANFTKTHGNTSVVSPPSTIAVTYTKSIQTIVGYNGVTPIYATTPVTYADFFQAQGAGTSSATATASIVWNPGPGNTTVDGTVTWINLGTQCVWSGASAQQINLNPSGINVGVSGVWQVQDSNGNLQVTAISGLSGSGAPTWSKIQGGNTVDNKVTWICGGPSSFAATFQPWLYCYSYKNDVTLDQSTASPLSTPITLNASSVIIVQGVGSGDTQVGTIPIYRTAQGQATPVFLGSVPNPGAGVVWTFTDAGTPDANLVAQIAAPIASANNPPPAGLTALEYHCGRIWGIVGNVVRYTNAPLSGTGNSLSQWAPLNSIPLPEQGVRLFAGVTNQGPTLFIYGTSNVYAIFGSGTAANPFTPAVKYMDSVGILSYDAITAVGSTHYLFSTKKKFVSLDPSAGYVEVGFPIGDQFNNVTTGANSGATMGSLYNPASTYVTWCEQSSGDTALYVSDGAVGWFRFSPVASPESGYLWSPRAAILGGTSAVQSVETSPGINQLLIAPASSGPILFRDSTVRQDYVSGAYASYPSWTVKGNIVLCQSGEVAEIAHIGLKSMAVGSRPLVGLLLGEIAATTATPFDTLQITGNDPPELPPSQTLYSDRYTALQNGVCPKCDNFQLKIDYGAQNAADEELVFSVYGAKHSERREQ
jgi:hypothetical protein